MRKRPPPDVLMRSVWQTTRTSTVRLFTCRCRKWPVRQRAWVERVVARDRRERTAARARPRPVRQIQAALAAHQRGFNDRIIIVWTRPTDAESMRNSEIRTGPVWTGHLSDH